VSRRSTSSEDEGRRGEPFATNFYAYPNADSHRAFGNNTLLRRAVLCALREVQVTKPVPISTGWAGVPNAVRDLTEPSISTVRQIDWRYRKQFQFNPPDTFLAIQNSGVARPETQNPEANLDTAFALGLATSSFEMAFSREQEVESHTMAPKSLKGTVLDGVPWQYIGVQKDVYDVFRVLLGGDATLSEGLNKAAKAELEKAGQPQPLSSHYFSIHKLTGAFFDYAKAGQYIYSRPVAVYFSRSLVFYGRVTGLNVRFTKFSREMVPTQCVIGLGLEIANASNSAASYGITGDGIITPTTPTTTTHDSHTSSSGGGGSTQPPGTHDAHTPQVPQVPDPSDGDGGGGTVRLMRPVRPGVRRGRGG
jgi:hypothetical protein